MQNQSCFGGRLIVAPLVHRLLIPSTPMHLKLINNPLCYLTDQIIIREVQLKSCHTLIKKCSFNFFEQCIYKNRLDCIIEFLRLPRQFSFVRHSLNFHGETLPVQESLVTSRVMNFKFVRFWSKWDFTSELLLHSSKSTGTAPLRFFYTVVIGAGTGPKHTTRTTLTVELHFNERFLDTECRQTDKVHRQNTTEPILMILPPRKKAFCPYLVHFWLNKNNISWSKIP